MGSERIWLIVAAASFVVGFAVGKFGDEFKGEWRTLRNIRRECPEILTPFGRFLQRLAGGSTHDCQFCNPATDEGGGD